MIERYGYKWEDGVSEATIELACYRMGGCGGKEKAYHLERAIKLLWPEPVYMFNYWTRRRIEAWCKWDWLTFWGASSTGKSTDVGVIVLAHWLSAPHCTTVTVCSTTKGALMKRIWAEVIKFYSYLGEAAPGRYYASRTAIIYPVYHGIVVGDGKDLSEDNPAVKYSRNGIFGIAIQRGSAEQARDDLIGVHNTYNVLVLDEMQSVREAALEAVANLQGGKEFKFIGMGNPSSRLDMLGRESMPKSGNWNDISVEDEWWETRRGACYFFDGRKSPAIVEEGGEKRYPFLLKRGDIEKRREWYGENSRRFWSQTIGFIPPEDIERVIFTETFLEYNGMMGDGGGFDSGFETCAGVDWGFVEGGDRCVIQFLKVGEIGGIKKCIFSDRVEVEVMADGGGIPVSYQVAKRVADECKRRGVMARMIGCDASGTQMSQCDILEQEYGERGVLRISFGSKADGVIDGVRFKNKATELWYQLWYLGRARCVHGIDNELALELINRKLVSDDPLQLESKREMRGRVGRSCDLADAAVCAVEVGVKRLGLMLNVGQASGGGAVMLSGVRDLIDSSWDSYGSEVEASYGKDEEQVNAAINWVGI